jgi:hypothetical protein
MLRIGTKNLCSTSPLVEAKALPRDLLTLGIHFRTLTGICPSNPMSATQEFLTVKGAEGLTHGKAIVSLPSVGVHLMDIL